MNHTPLFDLSQWEKSDRIQMEDFNSDNLKIENAISQKLEVVEFLNVSKVLNSATNWYVPVDGQALGNCFAFFIEYIFPKESHYAYRLLVNGSGLTYFSELYGGFSCLYGFPLRNPNQYVHLLPAGGARIPEHANTSQYAKLLGLNIKVTNTSDPLTGNYTLRIHVIP